MEIIQNHIIFKMIPQGQDKAQGTHTHTPRLLDFKEHRIMPLKCLFHLFCSV